jgi:hypothetical protein
MGGMAEAEAQGYGNEGVGGHSRDNAEMNIL